MDDTTGITSGGVSPVGSDCPTPEVSPLRDHSSSFENLESVSPRLSVIIPNRVFVGGFDQKLSEGDLWRIFSRYGALRDVNIVQSRYRLTKGYGFVTFENLYDAQRLLNNANGIFFRNKRLSIRQAIRRPSSRNLRSPQMSCGAVCLTTSSGFPYTFHNGVAYFHSPRISHVPQLWTPPSSPVAVPQPCPPVYQQPAFNQYQPRYFSNPWPWNSIEAPAGSGVIYTQPEYLHHVPDATPLQQPLFPHTDNNNAENYSIYPHSERIPHFIPPHEYGQNHMNQSFPVPITPVYNHNNRDHPSVPEQPEPEPQCPQAAQ